MEGPFTCESKDSLTKCKVIANHGAGYDQIDATYAASKGIWVANTPDVVGPATADIAMAHLVCPKPTFLIYVDQHYQTHVRI